MRPVHTLPTLDQIADDPARVKNLPRPVLMSLATRALTVHAATLTALLAAPPEKAEVVIPQTASRIDCPHCHRSTHVDEMIETPALGWACARCLEDSRPGVEAR